MFPKKRALAYSPIKLKTVPGTGRDLDIVDLNREPVSYVSLPTICRQLCLDALVEEGDKNFDWRLSFQEFKDLLSDDFRPSSKGNKGLQFSLNAFSSRQEILN